LVHADMEEVEGLDISVECGLTQSLHRPRRTFAEPWLDGRDAAPRF
jgi:hypothetical protein